MTRNVSGPNDTVAYPDGTGVITGARNNWWTFGPVGQGNTGEPGAFISTGPFVLVFSGRSAWARPGSGRGAGADPL